VVINFRAGDLHEFLEGPHHFFEKLFFLNLARCDLLDGGIGFFHFLSYPE
jgi:hypothetical protein